MIDITIFWTMDIWLDYVLHLNIMFIVFMSDVYNIIKHFNAEVWSFTEGRQSFYNIIIKQSITIDFIDFIGGVFYWFFVYTHTHIICYKQHDFLSMLILFLCLNYTNIQISWFLNTLEDHIFELLEIFCIT